jgi:Tol biopolymer transport system component
VLVAISLLCTCDTKKPFTATVLHQVKRVGSPVASPSGNLIVYTVREWNREKKTTTTWLEGVEDGVTRRLTYVEGKRDANPMFIDDKQLAFLSNREGSTQIYVLDLQTQKVTRISNIPGLYKHVILSTKSFSALQ